MLLIRFLGGPGPWNQGKAQAPLLSSWSLKARACPQPRCWAGLPPRPWQVSAFLYITWGKLNTTGWFETDPPSCLHVKSKYSRLWWMPEGQELPRSLDRRTWSFAIFLGLEVISAPSQHSLAS